MAEFLFSNLSGLALPTCRQIAEEVFGGKSEPFGENAAAAAKRIYDFIFSDQAAPAVLRAGGEAKDFFVRYPRGERCESVNEAQDRYYTERETKRDFSEKRRKLESLLTSRRKKEEKKLALLLERERDCADMEKNRIFGELITANIYQLRKGMDGCELVNYYDESAAPVKIPLDRTLAPAQNAQKYYKKYNKQKRTLAAVAPQKEEALSDLDYTNSMLSALARAENMLDLAEIEEELRTAGKPRPRCPSAPSKRTDSISLRGGTTCRMTACCGRRPAATSGCIRKSTTARMCSSARRGKRCPTPCCWRRRKSARIFRTGRRATRYPWTGASGGS